MAVIQKIFKKEFFNKIDGKILKTIETKDGEKLHDVRVAVNIENLENMDIAILPGDLMVPGLITVLKPEDVVMIELYDNRHQMIDMLEKFSLKPPSYLLEQLISDLATIKRREQFDQQLTDLLGEQVIKRLCAALWMIDDPNVERRFALAEDIEEKKESPKSEKKSAIRSEKKK